MTSYLRYLLLLLLKAVSRVFYRFRVAWVGEVPEEPWGGIRVAAILNHTSLFEWLFTGLVPNHFLRRIASQAVVPVAEKTIRRPVIGHFFKVLTPHMVPISREADHTWKSVLERISGETLVIILPEGRMMRANGLDKDGRPMTVRGGIADILRAVPEGRLLLAYSGGLHHVQVPGQLLPRPFKTLRMRFESLDLASYRRSLAVDPAADPREFKERIKADLERRRELYCRGDW